MQRTDLPQIGTVFPGVYDACARAIQAWQRIGPEIWRIQRVSAGELTWDQWPGSYLKESWSLVR